MNLTRATRASWKHNAYRPVLLRAGKCKSQNPGEVYWPNEAADIVDYFWLMIKAPATVNKFPVLLLSLLLFAAAVLAQQRQPSATDHVLAGVAAQKEGKHEEAVEHYAAALNLDPNNFVAHFNSGVSYLALKKFDAALKAFEQAVTLQPSDAIPNFYLGSTARLLGKHETAVASLKRATELKPDWTQAFLELGRAYEDLGDPEKFLLAIKQSHRLNATDVETLTALGHALRANQKFKDAVDPLKRVVAARPDDVELLYLLGNTQLMAGKHNDAIKTLNRVLVLDPNHSEARERLRVSSIRKDMPNLDLLRQQIEDNPRSSHARAELGQAYNSMGLFAEAEQEYLKAVALDPRNADSRVRLCVNYSEWGKLDLGIECYQQAIKLKSHHVLFMSLGDLYQRQGKLEEAAVAYHKSIEMKPTFTFSLYGLGFVLIKQGRDQEAIEPLRRLLEVEPKHIYGNHALGIAYARTGNKTGAMQQYYTLQNLNPRLAAELLTIIPK